MKKIKTSIQPHMLTRVIDSLRVTDDLPGITVSEVRGFGRNRARPAGNRIAGDFIEYARKAKLEVVVPDQMVEQVVDTAGLFAWQRVSGGAVAKVEYKPSVPSSWHGLRRGSLRSQA